GCEISDAPHPDRHQVPLHARAHSSLEVRCCSSTSQFWPREVRGGELPKSTRRGAPKPVHTQPAPGLMSALAPHSLSHFTVPPSEQEEQVRRDVHAANDTCSLIVAVELCLT
ncbi:hypothetical protein CCUS01_04177, partial [Colletotrichum cuscutae]